MVILSIENLLSLYAAKYKIDHVVLRAPPIVVVVVEKVVRKRSK
jgi:hypothetical protein